MRRKRVLCQFILITLILCFMAFPARAEQPSSVILYPSGGLIQGDSKLKVESGQISFDLPAKIQTNTLMLVVNGYQVTSLSVTPAPPQPDTPKVAKIRERLQEARVAAAGLEGEMEGLKARIDMWTNKPLSKNEMNATTTTLSTVEDMHKLDQMIGERLTALYKDVATITPKQNAAVREVTRLENELLAAGGSPTSFDEGFSIIADIDPNIVKSSDGTVLVHYSYILDDCGWKPVYTLNALTEKNQVHCIQEAEIHQASGQDWTDVKVTLATNDFGRSLKPSPVQPWKIYPAPTMMRATGSAVTELTAFDDTEKAAAPRMMKNVSRSLPIEAPTTTVWELGKRTIPLRRNVRFALAESDWRATFVRLARPIQGKNAWLMAHVMLPAPTIFPEGIARYFVDGVSIGQESFSLVGTDEKLYFGIDPRVSVDMKLDTRKSGKSGIVDQRQTRSWNWTIAVTNNHSTLVKVQIEDPEPQSGDNDIRITTSTNIKPEVEDHMNIWSLEVAAGKTENITWSVDISAPSKMRIIDGR